MSSATSSTKCHPERKLECDGDGFVIFKESRRPLKFSIQIWMITKTWYLGKNHTIPFTIKYLRLKHGRWIQ